MLKPRFIAQNRNNPFRQKPTLINRRKTTNSQICNNRSKLTKLLDYGVIVAHGVIAKTETKLKTKLSLKRHFPPILPNI